MRTRKKRGLTVLGNTKRPNENIVPTPPRWYCLAVLWYLCLSMEVLRSQRFKYYVHRIRESNPNPHGFINPGLLLNLFQETVQRDHYDLPLWLSVHLIRDAKSAVKQEVNGFCRPFTSISPQTGRKRLFSADIYLDIEGIEATNKNNKHLGSCLHQFPDLDPQTLIVNFTFLHEYAHLWRQVRGWKYGKGWRAERYCDRFAKREFKRMFGQNQGLLINPNALSSTKA